jgi:hypothetical protein
MGENVANPSRARRRAAIALSTLSLLLALPARGDARRGDDRARLRHSDDEAAIHDVHLSYSRVVVDGTSIRWRVRLFRDDLERALRAQSRGAVITAEAPAADSVFADYFNARVSVTANGRRLAGRVTQSGRDADVSDDEMWWYLVELTAPAAVSTIATRVGLLFELFDDQRNVLTLLKMPAQGRHSMYFVGNDPREQVIRF